MCKPQKRVFVTGFNIITSLGLNWKESWKNLLLGKSGVKPITSFDTSSLQTKIAACIPNTFDEYSKGYISKRSASQMTRVTKMCFVCAKDAVNQSGLNFDQLNRAKCGAILGVVSTGNTSVEKETTAKNRVLKSMNNAMSAWISLEYKLLGPNFTVSSACASSAYAIALGYDMIKNGMADVMIVGGADSIVNPEEIEGFNELYALSVENDSPGKASKPFSADRDGFVIGEGAGIVILESENSALARNAKIYGEIAGYGISSEAYNIMAPMKNGEGIAFTMQLALDNAGISANEVDYINAHGTSTMLNDKYETMAIKKVFGEHACKIPVSSSKSMIGHTIGAAGVIESVITMLSIENQIITPTINLDIPDEELDLDYVPHHSRNHKINYALSNSFAFGGHNASIVLKKYND